jgi:hypothetical protein
MDTGARAASMFDLNRAHRPPQRPGRDLHRSLGDIRGSPLDMAEDLLDHGSPSSCDNADPALLDEDSDNSDGKHDIVTPMTVDTGTTGNSDIDDPLYHQCKKARRSAFTDRLVSVSSDGTFGSSFMTISPSVGNMTDHDGLTTTFHGSRIREGQVTVNQSVSMTFDPNKMTCVICTNEHAIVGKKPVTVFFSDQNFCATLPCHNNDCLSIVRMEDATLPELINLSVELFGDVKFPEGSVFLYGTASYLSRVGTGIYAKEWLTVISNAERIWPGVRICPLIPLILSTVRAHSPGSCPNLLLG